MTFDTILYPKNEARPREETTAAPAYFTDLNLDQLIAETLLGKNDYNLAPFFYAPLTDTAAVQYRQEVARDLENETLRRQVNAFAEKMSVARRYLALLDKLHFDYHRKGWFVEAVDVYGAAVADLVEDLRQASLQSRGLLAFRDYIAAYANAPDFAALRAETAALKAKLAEISYCVIIKQGAVKVRKYEGEADYSVEVLKTFEKFQQGAVKDYLLKLNETAGMNHIEAKILELAARLYPEIFALLDDFCARHGRFLDETIRVFDREIQFYVAYLERIAPLKRAGLSFCYPAVGRQNKAVFNDDGFDLVLALKRVGEGERIVPNDFYLQDKERVIVVSGPNQGGKTTFARAFGQLHYLACLGLPAPGRQARLFLFDQLFTHFEREEAIQNLRGKLQDDLTRIHAILDRATPDSVLVLNEIFASTTLQDEVFLSEKIMERILERDILCVWVTFVDELASFSEKTVSMVSGVAPDNPAERTYRIVRKPADGLAHAMSIAEKYGLTYERIKERIPS